VGLSSHVGLYVLYESAHGRPVAIMEASALTAIRTAAASVVATLALARPDSRTLAVLGTGEEARSHIDAFQTVHPFERVIVWGRNPDAARECAEYALGAGCAHVEVAATVVAAAADADVICTVTGSPTAILQGRDVRKGTHLCLVGASIPSSREVDDDFGRGARPGQRAAGVSARAGARPGNGGRVVVPARQTGSGTVPGTATDPVVTHQRLGGDRVVSWSPLPWFDLRRR
jgi:ornithine cyclodeaminase